VALVCHLHHATAADQLLCREVLDSKESAEVARVARDGCRESIGISPCFQIDCCAATHNGDDNEAFCLVFLVQLFQSWCTRGATTSTKACVLDEHNVVAEVVELDLLAELVGDGEIVDDVTLSNS